MTVSPRAAAALTFAISRGSKALATPGRSAVAIQDCTVWSCTAVAAKIVTSAPRLVVRNGAIAWVSFAPMPITGKPDFPMAAAVSSSPVRPESAPWLLAIDATAIPASVSAAGGARKVNDFGSGSPPVVIAVSRFTTVRSAAASPAAATPNAVAGSVANRSAVRAAKLTSPANAIVKPSAGVPAGGVVADDVASGVPSAVLRRRRRRPADPAHRRPAPTRHPSRDAPTRGRIRAVFGPRLQASPQNRDQLRGTRTEQPGEVCVERDQHATAALGQREQMGIRHVAMLAEQSRVAQTGGHHRDVVHPEFVAIDSSHRGEQLERQRRTGGRRNRRPITGDLNEAGFREGCRRPPGAPC